MYMVVDDQTEMLFPISQVEPQARHDSANATTENEKQPVPDRSTISRIEFIPTPRAEFSSPSGWECTSQELDVVLNQDHAYASTEKR